MQPAAQDLATAFAALCETEYHRLRSYLTAIVGPGEAEEVTQEALLRAYRHLGSFRGEGPLAAWVFRVGRSAALDHRRRVERERTRVALEEPSIEHGCPRGDAADTVELVAVLAGLDPEVVEPLLLVSEGGFSYAEVASILDIPVGTVRSRVFRARRALAGELARADAAGVHPGGGGASHAKPA